MQDCRFVYDFSWPIVDSGIVDVEGNDNKGWLIQYCSLLIVYSGSVNELVWEECEETDDTLSWTFNDLIFTLVFDKIV